MSAAPAGPHEERQTKTSEGPHDACAAAKRVVLLVADGTRRETVEQLFDLRELARSAAGDIPAIVALNKADLKDEWVLTAADTSKLIAGGFHTLTTSAKTGEGVEDAFRWIATATLKDTLPAVQPQVRHGN